VVRRVRIGNEAGHPELFGGEDSGVTHSLLSLSY
jgi:hypothetical protein